MIKEELIPSTPGEVLVLNGLITCNNCAGKTEAIKMLLASLV